MNISAVSFSKGFRGYDVGEVEAYVESVDQFAANASRNEQSMREKIQQLEIEVNRLREIETSLFRAMKLAEESQLHWQQKVEKEAELLLADARKQAEAILLESDQYVKKTALLVQNERNQMLAQVDQELKEKEREMTRIESVKNEIVSQLTELSQQTMLQVAKWTAGASPLVSEKKEKGKTSAVDKVKATKSSSAGKVAQKSKKTDHMDAGTISDDGLPTLNKVLEAYAKSSGPRGKVGDIN
jgi:cell division initiation protein